MASQTRKKPRLSKSQLRAARRVRRQRRRRFMRYLVGFAVAFVAFAFIGSLFLPSIPLEGIFGQDTPDGPGEKMEDQGRTHIKHGEDHPDYNSVPGTSGWHYVQPAAPARWGIHESTLPDEVLIHNLEHGYVNIHYDCPDGCGDLVNDLSEIVDDMTDRGGKVLMSPYQDMGTTIALTAWTFIDKFDVFDKARIAEFISSHESSPNAPEAKVPR